MKMLLKKGRMTPKLTLGMLGQRLSPRTQTSALVDLGKGLIRKRKNTKQKLFFYKFRIFRITL